MHVKMNGNAEQSVQSVPCAVTPRGFGHVYITNSVIQGNTRSSGKALEAWETLGGIYAQGMLVQPASHVAHALASEY